MADILNYVRDLDNHLRNAADLTATTAAQDFPANNLKALPIANPWRSVDGQLDQQKVLIDLGVNPGITSLFALVNHNLTPTAIVTLRAGGLPDPDGAQFQQVITPHRRNAWAIFDQAAYRYWSVTLSDAGNPQNHLRAGYLVLGQVRQLPEQYLPGHTRNPVKIIRKAESEIGSPIVGSTVSTGFRLEFSFAYDDQQTDILEDMLDSLDATPLFIVPDRDRRHGFFVRLENPLEPWQTTVHVDNAANSITVAFITDNQGFDIL